MKITVGVSNRHVHLTKEHFEILFGKEATLEVFKPLSQPSGFASTSKVTIKGPKGEMDNVRILGPFRKYTQVEISKTDAFKLGVNPPVRDSGDIIGSSPITIIGPNGTLELNEGCILATRHIHASNEEAIKYGLTNIKYAKVKVGGEKACILENVHIKYGDGNTLELHLDTDDANANLISQGDTVEVIIDEK